MNELSKTELELHAYVDGNLDEESMARVEDYLRNHPEAAARVWGYLRQKDDIRGFARDEVQTDDSPATYRLGKKLARQLHPADKFGGKRGLALAFLFVAGWFSHALLLPFVEGPMFSEEIVEAHLFSAADPAEVLPLSRERLTKLYSRIGELERLPDLRKFGFEPVGAQLLPSDEGMVLHIPYRNAAGTYMSYFLLHHPQDDEISRHTLHLKGVTMVYWQHDHSRYAVTANLPDEQLDDIVSFIDTSTGQF